MIIKLKQNIARGSALHSAHGAESVCREGNESTFQTDNGWPEVLLFIFPLACVVEASEDLWLFHLSLANTGGGLSPKFVLVDNVMVTQGTGKLHSSWDGGKHAKSTLKCKSDFRGVFVLLPKT